MAGFPGLDELFEGRHFDREMIILCVSWYLRFKLRFQDLVEMMAEHGLSMAHTTITLATSLCSSVRAPMEPVCAAGRGFGAR
jgi:transposase-like protein